MGTREQRNRPDSLARCEGRIGSEDLTAAGSLVRCEDGVLVSRAGQLRYGEEVRLKRSTRAEDPKLQAKESPSSAVSSWELKMRVAEIGPSTPGWAWG